jgi:hypothetical protein
LSNSCNNTLKKVRTYLRVARAGGIVRRYFVMNGFDGAMTKPEVILLAGFGACPAMGGSGFFGAFMAERAERDERNNE